jgi:hypothetical protein
MRARLGYGFLTAAILAWLFQGPLGLDFADWNEPITSTDVAFWFTALIGVIIIEVREAATWVRDQIKSDDS